MNRFKNLAIITAAVAALSLLLAVMGTMTAALDPTPAENVSALALYGQTAVAIVAAILVIYELNEGKAAEERDSRINEANFIQQYNESFIEDPNMFEIEAVLESDYIRGGATSFMHDVGMRQKCVNYLAYIEGIAPLILRNVLELSHVEDLFGYRFFIAMNNTAQQDIELIPYAEYYKGCYKLYELWYTHKLGSGTLEEIPRLNDRDLSETPRYELIVCPEFKIRKTEADGEGSRLTLCIAGKEAMRLICTGDINSKTVNEFCENADFSFETGRRHELARRALLKAVIFNDSVDTQSIGTNTLTETQEIVVPSGVLPFDADGMLGFAKDAASGAYLRKRTPHPLCQQLCFTAHISDEQAKEIAGLIYDTDPYIYPAMFGSRENALTIIPAILKKQDSMFSQDNMFILKDNGHIFGLVLWVRGSLKWDGALLRRCFAQNGLQLPEHFDKVAAEYISGYEDAPNTDSISILNVCISDEARGKGFGTRLLSEFIDNHKESYMELCVLNGNDPALALYESCGFLYLKEEDGFSVDPPKPRRQVMGRYPRQIGRTQGDGSSVH